MHPRTTQAGSKSPGTIGSSLSLHLVWMEPETRYSPICLTSLLFRFRVRVRARVRFRVRDRDRVRFRVGVMIRLRVGVRVRT